MLAPVLRLLPQVVAPRRPQLAVISSCAAIRLPAVSLRDLLRIRMGEPVVVESYLSDWMPVIEAEVRWYAARGGPAEELQAEGALALWEAALQYDPQTHRSAPARYIHNHIHRRVRKAYRDSRGFDRPAAVPLELVPAQARPDEGYAASEQKADLEAAVQHLGPAEQEQFRTYLGLALSGMGPDEAARVVSARYGTTFEAGKKRLERLRRRVKEKLRRS